MRAIARLICLFGLLSLGACGGSDTDADDQGAAGHSNDGGEVHAHDGGEMHEHNDGGRAHEAPETETFYGEEAAPADATGQSGPIEEADEEKGDQKEAAEMHSHGDGEPHTHDD